MSDLRAITIQQPTRRAVIHAGKTVENRTHSGMWRRAVGTTIAIHAGGRWSERGAEHPAYRRALARETGAVRHRVDVRGAIIGLVDVVDLHPAQGCCAPWGDSGYYDWRKGRQVEVVHLVLDKPRPVDPIPVRGQLGLWHVPADVEQELLAGAAR